MAALFSALPLSHPLLPGLQMRELLNIDASPSSSSHPAPVRDISDGNMVTDNISGLGLSEMLVQDTVQAAGLIDVSVHTVLNVLRGIPREVVSLALHGTNAGVLEEQPVVHLVVFAGALGEGDLVVGVILLCQVLQNAAGLEQADLLAVTESVRQSGDAAVGVDLEEPAAQLSVSGSYS